MDKVDRLTRDLADARVEAELMRQAGRLLEQQRDEARVERDQLRRLLERCYRFRAELPPSLVAALHAALAQEPQL